MQPVHEGGCDADTRDERHAKNIATATPTNTAAAEVDHVAAGVAMAAVMHCDASVLPAVHCGGCEGSSSEMPPWQTHGES